jgi:hypothetical protein
MVSRIPPKDLALTIKFGGGLHTRASAADISDREAADGKNFLLDLENKELRNRPPFDMIGTVPNAAEIRGGASLLKSDGTVSTLFQAGARVYEWDGLTGFTQVGTVSATAKLRGHWKSHNWLLSDKVLMTDLNLADTVKEWNGSTFQSVTFTKETSAAFGSFYAKYLTISNERAIFGHVKDGSSTSPHLIVGSKTSDYTNISVAQRPVSSLNTSDPFFIPMPDLKPINGISEAFGALILSTEKGRLFNLSGSTAKDFSFDEFFPGSAASGAESLTYIGTDIIYGRQGRVESVRDTAAFGNSESDDLTVGIADIVGGYTGWTNVYNSRLNRVYLLPDGQSECWVFSNAMRTSRQLSANSLNQFVDQSGVQKQSGDLSPWMKWTTTHALAFRPSFVMAMLDPLDGLEYVFMGDASGNIYRMEGTGTSGDGGSASINTQWLSKVFSAPLDAKAYDIEGYIKYKKSQAATVTLTFLAAGIQAFDQSVTITIPAPTANYFGGSIYFGGAVYFGVAQANRLIRQPFKPPGSMEDFQVRVDVDGTTDFNISEIGLRFKAASQ